MKKTFIYLTAAVLSLGTFASGFASEPTKPGTELCGGGGCKKIADLCGGGCKKIADMCSRCK